MADLNNNTLEEAFLKRIYDEIPMPIFYKDIKLCYKYFNKAYLQCFENVAKNMLNKTSDDFADQKNAKLYYQTDIAAINTGEVQCFKTKIINKNQEEVWYDVYKKPIYEDNSVIGIVGIMKDVTQEVIQTKKAEQMEKMKDYILEISNSLMEKKNIVELFEFILDKTLNLMENANFGSFLELENGILRIKASKGYLDKDAKSFALPLKESYQWAKSKGNIKKTMIINDIHDLSSLMDENVFLKNNKGQPIRSTISAPVFVDNTLFGFLSFDSVKNNTYGIKDYEILEYLRKQINIAITNYKLYEKTIYISEHDTLTGLKNRRYFEDLLVKNIERAKTNDEQFLVISFDLDGLKKINDSLGHLAGDELIRYFSKNLLKMIKEKESLSRTGGDEFLAIIKEETKESFNGKMEALRLFFMEDALIVNSHKIECNFSFGVSSFPEDGETYDLLVGKADDRMYMNKKEKTGGR